MSLVNEIRIGNWVLAKPIFGNNKTFEPLQITSPNEIYRCNNNPKDFEHIPLTEEILAKCSMTYPIIINGAFQAFNPSHEADFLWVINKDSEGYFLSFLHEMENPIIRVNYLHELQNAIFLLTKTELNYKP